MKIASAQICCVVGEIHQNLEEHYKMIELAAKKDVDLILFPEMSITGYCREEGSSLALSGHDKILDRLKDLSVERNMYIVAGGPWQKD